MTGLQLTLPELSDAMNTYKYHWDKLSKRRKEKLLQMADGSNIFNELFEVYDDYSGKKKIVPRTNTRQLLSKLSPLQQKIFFAVNVEKQTFDQITQNINNQRDNNEITSELVQDYYTTALLELVKMLWSHRETNNEKSVTTLPEAIAALKKSTEAWQSFPPAIKREIRTMIAKELAIPFDQLSEELVIKSFTFLNYNFLQKD